MVSSGDNELISTRSGSPFGVHYEKTGRVDALKHDSPLNSVPKKPSFIYKDFINLVATKARQSPDVKEGDGKAMRYLQNEVFQNWGRTVKNTPSYTFVARTRIGVQNLVKWASRPEVNKRVRAAGFRHTWGYVNAVHMVLDVMWLTGSLSKGSVRC